MTVMIYYNDPISQETFEEKVYSVAELEVQLDAIQNRFQNLDYPIGVDLENPNGDILSVGLGANEWVLVHTHNQVEQHCSIGDESLEGTVGFYLEQWTEIPCKWLVPKALAWEAVKYWFETGALNPAIKWSDQTY